jgi:hypothetical protein
VAGFQTKEPQFNYRYAATPNNNIKHSGALAANRLKQPMPTAVRPRDQIQGSGAHVEPAVYKPALRPCQPSDSMISQGVIKVRGIAEEVPPHTRALTMTPRNTLWASGRPAPDAPTVQPVRVSSTSPGGNLRHSGAMASGPEFRTRVRVSNRPVDNLFVSGALPFPRGNERDIMPMW